jgi:hypothetical protein
MPCAVKSNFKTGLHISRERSIIYTLNLTKTCFHASNRRSLLSENSVDETDGGGGKRINGNVVIKRLNHES